MFPITLHIARYGCILLSMESYLQAVYCSILQYIGQIYFSNIFIYMALVPLRRLFQPASYLYQHWLFLLVKLIVLFNLNYYKAIQKKLNCIVCFLQILGWQEFSIFVGSFFNKKESFSGDQRDSLILETTGCLEGGFII